MDAKIRESINKAKEFMQLWVKFHDLYKEAMGKASINPDEEKVFFDTKAIIARKFQTLADSMAIDRYTIDRTFDVINQILSLKGISTLSEHELKKIENDWHQSYISLNRLLGHLEAAESTPTDRGRTSTLPASGTGSGLKGILTSAITFIVFIVVIAVIANMLGIDIVGLVKKLVGLQK